MKNVIKILSIISLVLVITLASCGGGGSGSGKTTPVDNSGKGSKGDTIPVKIKAYNNKGVTPSKSEVFNVRAAEMRGNARSVQTNFAMYNEIYDFLGTKQGPGITPTKFYLFVRIEAYTSTGKYINLGNGYFDFANGNTITLGEEVPRDVTIVAIKFSGLSMVGSVEDTAFLEFNWPFYTGTNDNNGKKTNYDASEYYRMNMVNLAYIEEEGGKYDYFNTTVIDGKVNIFNYFLDPVFAAEVAGSWGWGHTTDSIIYGGDSRKLYDEDVPVSDIIPGVNKIEYGKYLTGYDDYFIAHIDFGKTVVVPFSPITIPSNASSVTFEVSWDLQNLIQPYKTTTDKETVVYKNGFWEGLYINAKIDY